MLALQEKGTLTEAAEALFLSQSALSHQIRHLEAKLNIKLWQRCGRRLRLTTAGELLLSTAQQITPQLLHTENKLKAMGQGQLGVLRIGVECFPCHEWLNGVVADFLSKKNNVDIDIIRQFEFSGEEGLLQHRIDLLITPDVIDHQQLLHIPLFEYEQVLVTAQSHPLASYANIIPKQLRDQVLITFPIETARLDIFRYFLHPAQVQPENHKKIESLSIILQMVKHGRGVAVLPAWLAENYRQELSITCCRLGDKGLFNTLYASIKKQDHGIPYIADFIALAQ